MKIPLRKSSAHLVTTFAFVLAAMAEENPSTKPPAPMVEIEAHFLHATDQQVREALHKLNDEKPASSGTTVLALISAAQSENVVQALRDAKAEFFSSPRLVTKSGQRASVESVREVRYPTEFDPDKSGRPVPTAFETRNVGVTCEIEPVTGPAGKIDINIVPSVVSFLGFIDYGSSKPPATMGASDGIDRALRGSLKAGGIWQPVFASSKVTTSLTLLSGQFVLLGGMAENSPASSSAPAPKGKPVPAERFIYILLTARAVGN